MNLPNSITLSRIAMIPLLLWILSTHFPWQANGEQEVLASILFVLASITDGLDGYLARKRAQILAEPALRDGDADRRGNRIDVGRAEINGHGGYLPLRIAMMVDRFFSLAVASASLIVRPV